MILKSKKRIGCRYFSLYNHQMKMSDNPLNIKSRLGLFNKGCSSSKALIERRGIISFFLTEASLLSFDEDGFLNGSPTIDLKTNDRTDLISSFFQSKKPLVQNAKSDIQPESFHESNDAYLESPRFIKETNQEMNLVENYENPDDLYVYYIVYILDQSIVWTHLDDALLVNIKIEMIATKVQKLLLITQRKI